MYMHLLELELLDELDECDELDDDDVGRHTSCPPK